jgi:hypothetical protein
MMLRTLPETAHAQVAAKFVRSLRSSGSSWAAAASCSNLAHLANQSMISEV